MEVFGAKQRGEVFLGDVFDDVAWRGRPCWLERRWAEDRGGRHGGSHAWGWGPGVGRGEGVVVGLVEGAFGVAACGTAALMSAGGAAVAFAVVGRGFEV